MKSKNLWLIVVITVIAIVGIDGIITALPHASESTHDLLIDFGLLVLIVAASVFLANIRTIFGKRKKTDA